jgi:hypothetical protein
MRREIDFPKNKQINTAKKRKGYNLQECEGRGFGASKKLI